MTSWTSLRQLWSSGQSRTSLSQRAQPVSEGREDHSGTVPVQERLGVYLFGCYARINLLILFVEADAAVGDKGLCGRVCGRGLCGRVCGCSYEVVQVDRK